MNAAKTYRTRAKAIELMMDDLHDALVQHAARQDSDQKNWGLVGDLGAVGCALANVIAQLHGDPDGAETVLRERGWFEAAARG